MEFFDGSTSRQNKKGSSNKKEDRDAFLARTQANRQARQHTKQMETSATRIQSLYRSWRCLCRERDAARQQYDSILATEPADTWDDVSHLVRLTCFVCSGSLSPGTGDLARLLKLTPIVLRNAEKGSYFFDGLSKNASISTLQLKRLSELIVRCLVACEWTLKSSDPAAAATLLRALLVLTDARQWKAVPASSLEAAENSVAICLKNLVLKCQFFSSLRSAIMEATAIESGNKVQLSVLLCTLALRPLLSRTDSSINPENQASYQSFVAFKFAVEILSIPCLPSRFPPVLRPSLVHRSTWPRLVFSMGSAAKFGIFAQHEHEKTVTIPDDRILCLLANIIELTEESRLEGLQLIYLSAMERLTTSIPAEALINSNPSSSAQSAPQNIGSVHRQLNILYTPAHVHWLLRGMGGKGPTDTQSSNGPATPASRDGVGAQSSEVLSTWDYKDWHTIYSGTVSGKKGADGRPIYSEAVQAFCSSYASLLRLWPSAAVQILNCLAFDSPVHCCLWSWIGASGLLRRYIDDGSEPDLTATSIFLFCKYFLHRLMVTDDQEFYEQQRPFPLAELVDMALLLRQYVSRRFWGRGDEATTAAVAARIAGTGQGRKMELRQMEREAATQLMHQLYDRNARKEFCPIDTWLDRGFKMDAFGMDTNADDSKTLVVLREFPHIIPLHDRYRILQKLMAEDRQSTTWPDVHVRIRRKFVVDDGFSELNHLRSGLKGTVKVHFVNESGLDEMGIDMGGLYKEFLTCLIERAFDPSYGLFRTTASRQLYPNPGSHLAVRDHLEKFAFLGRMLGKAIFDGIQIDLPFCGFFLSKLLGKRNYLDELPSLDPDLHRNLMQLKDYKGNVSDLSLDFTVQDDDGSEGGSSSSSARELVPGGSKIEVTNANRIQYIHLVADYRLNKQIKKQCEAFLSGFQDMVRVEWIRFFNPVELQVLISGERHGGDFDVEDLKANTVYSGGYYANDSTVKKLWRVVKEFSPRDKSLFLKFVTSCPRPPLLGFSSLRPPFCVHRVPSERTFFEMLSRKEEQRLPTASTCMNLLKLPEYISSKTLRDKLLYSIRSNAGFELS